MRFLFLVLLASCDMKTRKDVLVCIPAPESRAWVIECITAGNPKSDEEGEDLVEQCETTAANLFPASCTFVSKCYNGGAELPLHACVVGVLEFSKTPSKKTPKKATPVEETFDDLPADEPQERLISLDEVELCQMWAECKTCTKNEIKFRFVGCLNGAWSSAWPEFVGACLGWADCATCTDEEWHARNKRCDEEPKANFPLRPGQEVEINE